MSPKRALRQVVREKRDALAESERRERARQIKERLFSLPEFKNAHAILFYAAFGGEVPTYEMMEESLEMGKRVILPITDTETKHLVLREVRDLNNLKKNKYGIPEPGLENTLRYEPGLINLVIVPGVAFDPYGHRIGYGGGYYDRFLRKLKPSVSKIGIAFDIQIVPEIPKEEYDLPVDEIVTESRVITKPIQTI